MSTYCPTTSCTPVSMGAPRFASWQPPSAPSARKRNIQASSPKSSTSGSPRKRAASDRTKA